MSAAGKPLTLFCAGPSSREVDPAALTGTLAVVNSAIRLAPTRANIWAVDRPELVEYATPERRRPLTVWCRTAHVPEAEATWPGWPAASMYGERLELELKRRGKWPGISLPTAAAVLWAAMEAGYDDIRIVGMDMAGGYAVGCQEEGREPNPGFFAMRWHNERFLISAIMRLARERGVLMRRIGPRPRPPQDQNRALKAMMRSRNALVRHLLGRQA